MLVRGRPEDPSGEVDNGLEEDDTSVRDGWARVKRRLRAELGEDVFTSWLARLELDHVSRGCAQLSVPTRFLKSWIEAHYLDRVVSTFRSERAEVASVAIVVRSAFRGVLGRGGGVSRGRGGGGHGIGRRSRFRGRGLGGGVSRLRAGGGAQAESDNGGEGGKTHGYLPDCVDKATPHGAPKPANDLKRRRLRSGSRKL